MTFEVIHHVLRQKKFAAARRRFHALWRCGSIKTGKLALNSIFPAVQILIIQQEIRNYTQYFMTQNLHESRAGFTTRDSRNFFL